MHRSRRKTASGVGMAGDTAKTVSPTRYTAAYYLEKHGIIAVVYMVHGLGYLAMNHLLSSGRGYDLSTWVDRAIPLAPGWSWCYLLIYITPAGMIFFVDDLVTIRRTGLAVLFCDVVAWPVFLLMPVTMTRSYVPIDSVHTELLNFIYIIDKPRTCFPSLHVATSLVIMSAVWHQTRFWGALWILICVLISVSTLYTKQHYFLDVLAGLILGWSSHRFIFLGEWLARFPALRGGHEHQHM